MISWDFALIQIILGVLMILSAAIAVKLRDLLAAVIAMAGFSLLLSLEFYVLQAPDVAMAEAAIGAGLVTAIYALAIKYTRRMEVEE